MVNGKFNKRKMFHARLLLQPSVLSKLLLLRTRRKTDFSSYLPAFNSPSAPYSLFKAFFGRKDAQNSQRFLSWVFCGYFKLLTFPNLLCPAEQNKRFVYAYGKNGRQANERHGHEGIEAPIDLEPQ